MPLLFASVLFLNALLLFWVQPLFAKMVLPVLGGSPSVWTTCMLFFQAALLAGYAYSHVGLRWLGARTQAVVHTGIVWLPLLVLPFEVAQVGATSAATEPIRWLLTIVATSVGLPFVILAATAPLLQHWYTVARRGSSDPYWLYAASNAGSLVALLAFPMVFEPLLPTHQQSGIWKVSYGIVAALLTACALAIIRRHQPAMAPDPEGSESSPVEPPSAGKRAQWVALSFAPSSLLLGVTTYLSTDVAPVPLLWVLPLSFYLLTFIVAFSGYSDTMRGFARRMLPRVLLPLLFIALSGIPVPLWLAIPLHIGGFSILALACHGELALRRPHVRYLTEFYLWLALGGVLGGIFNTLVAPQLFTSVAEYPIVIGIGCLLCVSRDQVRQVMKEPRRLITPAIAAAMAIVLLVGERLSVVPTMPMIGLLTAPIMMCVSFVKDSARFAAGIVGLVIALLAGNALGFTGGGQVLDADRTFFGVYRVAVDREGRMISLMHGTTNHGTQVRGDRDPEPLTYYHRQSPVGQVLAMRAAEARSVGVIGLGAGTLAKYVQPGSSWTFYEIDAVVEQFARDTRYFHYLERCGEQCSVVIGDARLTLAQREVTHDVLVLDAFSSDAIPLHLLTTEALEMYKSRLAPEGLLVIHISNRHILLRPVIARLARDSGLVALAQFERPPADALGANPSEWVVLAQSQSAIGSLAQDSRWQVLEADNRSAWTDNFSNIWTELR